MTRQSSTVAKVARRLYNDEDDDPLAPNQPIADSNGDLILDSDAEQILDGG